MSKIHDAHPRMGPIRCGQLRARMDRPYRMGECLDLLQAHVAGSIMALFSLVRVILGFAWIRLVSY